MIDPTITSANFLDKKEFDALTANLFYRDVVALIKKGQAPDPEMPTVDETDVQKWIDQASTADLLSLNFNDMELIENTELAELIRDDEAYTLTLNAHQNAGNDLDVQAIQAKVENLHPADLLARLS